MIDRALTTALTFLAILFLLSAWFFVLSNVVPQLFLFALFVTAGLVWPLAFLNTVLLYLLAASPALLCLRTKPYNWGIVAGAAVLIPIVAVVPPLISQSLTFRHAERLLADDINTGVPEPPKSIELIAKARPYTGRRSPLGDTPCEALCQRLLLSRQVDLVRVQPDDAPRAIDGLDYVLEPRASCPDAFAETAVLLPETRDAVISGTCFVAQEPGPAPMAARIEIRKTSFPSPQNLLENLSRMADVVRGLQVLKISVAEPGGWSLKLKKTEVIFSHWTMPLRLHLAERGGRPVFGSVVGTLNAFDPDELALRTLGIKEVDPANRLSPAARVMAMLDRTGSFFALDEKRIVADWVNSVSCRHQACGPVAGADEAVLQRLLKDSRTTYFFGQEISRHPGFVTDNFDVVLDRMTASGANSLFSNAVGAAVARLDIEKLRARRDRIMPLIRDNDWKLPQGIGIVSGRLGVDTADLISERLARPASAETAAMAACMADVTIGQQLVPALLAYLRAPDGNRVDHASRDVIIALARFGHLDEVKELARARYRELAEQYLRGRSAADMANDITPCDRR
jgi:hypothetical protein